MITAFDKISKTPVRHCTHLASNFRDIIGYLVRSMGYEIRRSESHLYKRPIDFIRSRNIDVVVDVGANVGQYGERLRHAGYSGWIVSAEPVRQSYEALKARAAADPGWKVLNLAFGQESGRAVINVSEASVLSSLQAQTSAAAEFNPEFKVTGRETVQVARLDEIFHDLPKGRRFLKVDTQGYEQQVLEGSAGCISEFLGVQLELPIIHLYEEVWRFHEAVSYMERRGFEISNIIPVNYDHGDTVSLVEVDCIFRRRLAHPSGVKGPPEGGTAA
jgi:FkbM family methyltransferase